MVLLLRLERSTVNVGPPLTNTETNEMEIKTNNSDNVWELTDTWDVVRVITASGAAVVSDIGGLANAVS